jgi:hypothetical protein
VYLIVLWFWKIEPPFQKGHGRNHRGEMLPNTHKFVAISVGIVAVFLLSNMAVLGAEDKGNHVLGGLKGMSVSGEL